MKRREFLKNAGVVSLLPFLREAGEQKNFSTVVNDVHTGLNPTRVYQLVKVTSVDDVCAAIRNAGKAGHQISIAGGRHAAGGQQFGANTVLLDTTTFHHPVALNTANGHLEVEAGIEWPELVAYTINQQKSAPQQWAIAQKQGGGDRFTIGGTLSANAHGHALNRKPIVADVESFVLVDAQGVARKCSRLENTELFTLAIGGYGLFGVITSVTLRLVPRGKLQRIVEWARIEDTIPRFAKLVSDGHMYGDFQYSIDQKSQDFMRKGVLTSYRPVAADTPLDEKQGEFSAQEYTNLLALAHAAPKAAFDKYASKVLATSGQIYWSDLHQMSVYPLRYHQAIDKRFGAAQTGTDPLTEIYVPRRYLPDFMEEVRADFLHNKVHLVYGTIRLIERDDETFLAWARESYACVIFTLHTDFTPPGLARFAATCRRLIDLAGRRGGSFYLTYHRFATREQMESCYPQFAAFLALKKKYDPDELFQSEWYRHVKKLFA